jgi:YfiH family protein
MQRFQHENGVVTYTFDSLAQLPVRAHVSTRHGGVSPAPWHSLNFSILRGDTPVRVQQNRDRLAAALGIEPQSIIRCRQVHGVGIAKVGIDDAGQWQEGIDGLITNTAELPLMLVFADCAPILLYDRHRHALGVCHAGWRGTINGIADITLWAMRAAYDTDPADVVACIGPSIGPQSYQVGEEVVTLAQVKLKKPERFFQHLDGPDHNPYFDLWAANAAQLYDAGVPPNQIEISGIDTARQTAEFFSHRAERGRCGLFTMTAWLQTIETQVF